MQIDIAPETERLVRDEINSGHFRSVDEMIRTAVLMWQERNTEQPVKKRNSRPIWEVIADNMKNVPPEDLAALPNDGASQIDHYVYGVPKRDQ